MKTFETVGEFRSFCTSSPRPLGLVPTMGSLHAGHVALLGSARVDNSTVAASIFVNPAQFDEAGDFRAYPRSLEADLAAMEQEGVDLVFTPSVNEMYPDGFDTRVDVGNIGRRLEGEYRPGHFQGVATVVCKLLAISRPDRVYFGQKDAQQCLVIKRLNADLNLGAEVVVVPTVREADGLALSSRNVLLGPEERKAAVMLYRALCEAQSLWDNGETDAEAIRVRIRAVLDTEPLAVTEYVSVADTERLDGLASVDRRALVSLAVRIGPVRLIDNIVLEEI